MRLGMKGKKKGEDFIEQLQAQGQNVIESHTDASDLPSAVCVCVCVRV